MKTKNLIVILALLTLQIAGYNQIKYEGTHDEGLKTFQLDNGEIIYTAYKKSEQSISIYNLDHSKWGNDFKGT